MLIHMSQETQRTSRSLTRIGLRLLPTYKGRKAETSTDSVISFLLLLHPSLLLFDHLPFLLPPSAVQLSPPLSSLRGREGGGMKAPFSIKKPNKTLMILSSFLPKNHFPPISLPYFFPWEKGSGTFLQPRAELVAEETGWKILRQRQPWMRIWRKCQSHS